MSFLFTTLPILALIPFGIYFYFYIKRIIELIGFDTHKMYIRIIIAVLSFLFVLPAKNIWGIWFVVVSHLFVFCIIIELIGLLLCKLNHGERISKSFYQSGILPILCLVLLLTYGNWNMKNVVEQSYKISTDKNIQQNYRVAFISDLHFGTTMNKNKLKLYCQAIQDKQPDIVVLGGDIVDENSTKKQMEDAFEVLGNMKAQYGVYYVYGNHDQSNYSKTPNFTSEELRQTITDSQIHILNDQSSFINDDLVIIGRNDVRHPINGERLSSQQLINDIDTNKFLLLVDHQPIELKENAQAGYDLQLSGHTHGGQIFPVGLISDFLSFGEVNYGYKQIDDFQVIVSSGMAGWGYSLRTGSQSEYEIIDIVKK